MEAPIVIAGLVPLALVALDGFPAARGGEPLDLAGHHVVALDADGSPVSGFRRADRVDQCGLGHVSLTDLEAPIVEATACPVGLATVRAPSLVTYRVAPKRDPSI